MAGGLTSKALRLGFDKLVDTACERASNKMTNSSKITEPEKEGVKDLICEAMSFTADLVIDRNAGAAEVGQHLLNNNIALSKLTKNQQIYCTVVKGQMIAEIGKLAAVAASTYTATLVGLKGGVVAGGITGTVVAGPGGTVAGAVAGGVIGGGAPFAIGSYEMYESVTTIFDHAININQQCGALAMDKAPPARTPQPVVTPTN